MKHEVRYGNNKYVPGLFEYTVELCDLAASLAMPILYVIIPKERLLEILHPCPYKAVSFKESIF
jgi:hypothetical protein